MSAIEFKTNTQPKATDTCFSSAFITGVTAAIALPPHIAVPAEIKKEVFCSMFNQRPIK